MYGTGNAPAPAVATLWPAAFFFLSMGRRLGEGCCLTLPEGERCRCAWERWGVVAEEPPRDFSTLAAKVDYLFTTVHPRGRGPYSNPEVAAAIEADGQVSCSASFLYLLRTGKRSNPSLLRLTALAKFFGVDPAFFFNDDVTRGVAEELEFVVALRDAGIKGLALRAAGLSDLSLNQLRQMVEYARTVEGLPPEPDSALGGRRRDDPQPPALT